MTTYAAMCKRSCARACLARVCTDWRVHAAVHSPRARRGGAALRCANARSERACLKIACELVTNAIRHGAGTARIAVSHAGGDLRVEVHDSGEGRPARRRPSADDDAGRGLALIDGLIELQGGQRGITEDASGSGKTVYVVIALAVEAPG